VRDKLALWGRRLLGEAITHAQHVLAERDGLAELIISGSGTSRASACCSRQCSKGTASGWPRWASTSLGERLA
jgi:hypothetical protein